MKGDKRAGRPKGVPNKLSGAVKDMILQALSNQGGVAYLERQAEEQPAAFLGLVKALLPIQNEHSGADGTPLTVIQRVETRASE